MTSTDSIARSDRYRVVIAGGGVAALEAMLALRALAEDRVAVDLIAPDREFAYRPLTVGAPFGVGRSRSFDLSDLARQGGARHYRDAIKSVDVRGRRVTARCGAEFPYDALLVAVGAGSHEPLQDAVTFRGEGDVKAVRNLLAEMSEGRIRKLVFALASSLSWSLPLYELALMTARHLDRAGLRRVQLTLVTPEARPLAIFGEEASIAVERRLSEGGIAVRTGVSPIELRDGRLMLLPGGQLSADAVVTLAVPNGRAIPGLAPDAAGFLPTDRHGRVRGFQHVFAAGDITDFPLKQGGLAAQQADAAAQAIAAEAGSSVAPAPFHPVLRGLLLTGEVPEYLRATLGEGGSNGDGAGVEPLWWPPMKIAAKYLGPFLASQAGQPEPLAEVTATGLQVAREFDTASGGWHDIPARTPVSSGV